jgi:hypothetical protein
MTTPELLRDILQEMRGLRRDLRAEYGEPLETEAESGLREIEEFLATDPQPDDRGCGVRVFED